MAQRQRDLPDRRRVLKRSGAAIVGLLLLCVLLIAVLYLLDRKPNVGLPIADAHEHTGLVVDRDSLLSVTVTPSTAAAYTLVREGDTFAVEGETDYPLKEVDLDNLIAHVHAIEQVDVVTELSELDMDLAEFGFTEGSPRVTAQLTGGGTLGFRFGADAPTENPTVYFLVDDDPHLYTINRSVRDLFDLGVNFLHTVPEIGFSDVQGIHSITVLNGGEQLVIEPDGTGNGSIVSPVRYPMDPLAMALLLDNISNLRLAVFVEDIDDQTDMQSYGLSDSSPSIRIVAENAPDLLLQLGNDIRGLGMHCAYDGAVYMATNMALAFVQTLDVESIAFRGITDIPFREVTRMEVASAGLTHAYDVLWYERIAPNNALTYDEHGQVVMDAEVTADGQIVDTSLLEGFHARLAAQRAEAFVEGAYDQPLAAPWLTIRIQAGARLQVLAFHHMGNDQSALTLDGVTLWSFNEAALQAAIQHLLGA